MHFRKRFLATAAVVAIAAAVVFAGTLEISSVEENNIISWFGKKETIYFWYSDDAMTNYINSAAVSFGEKEGVRVIPILLEDSDYLEAINKASLHSGQIPDCYVISNDSLEKAYLAGLAGEISDVENICSSEHFPDTALAAASYKGKTIAYPFFYDTSVLVYNETYLEEWARQQAYRELSGGSDDGEEVTDEPVTEGEAVVDETALSEKTQAYLLNGIPGTVDDILQLADTFDVPEGVEGVMKWDVSDIFYNYWIVGNYMIIGGDAGDDEKNININNEQTVSCLEVYKALNQFFSIESDTVTYDSVIQDFIDGKLVFTIGTSDVVRRLEEAKAEGEFAYEYGIALMPDISSELKSRSLSVTNVVVINGYSEHKELANRFAAYLTDGYTENLYERTGKVSANINANQDNGALQILLQEYSGSVSLPKMMEIGNLWLQLEALFAKVWNGAEVTPLVQELADQITTQLIVQ